MKPIRWGIVGPGSIANKFAKAIQNVDGVILNAVASRSVESGNRFAETYQIPHVFCGYENMAVSDTVDAVYIATPHPFHITCAELFLNHKKHVLCEKPLCVNAEQAIRLKECAHKNGMFLMEAMWTRFLPAIETARTLVQQGQIGQVLGVEADFCYRSTPQEDSRIFRNDMAGGALLDVGIYSLHFASFFLGYEPEQIHAQANVADGVDLHTVITNRYANGAIASLSCAINLQKPETAYVYGTDGSIFLPCFYGATELTLTGKDGSQQRIPCPCIGNGFEEEIYEACRCIRAGKLESDTHPLSDSITILHQMDDIRKQIGLSYPFDR